MPEASVLKRLRRWASSVKPTRPLQGVFLLALLNGFLYFLLIPPWWHYDEPGQFEFVWLVANRPSWPRAGDSDQTTRLEMARSMQYYGWYALRGVKPDLSGNKPVWIGEPQVGSKPAYYFLASLPLRLLRGSNITLQYYAVRLVSLLCYLVTILVLWKAAGELLGEGHPLQWLVTGFIALLPAFTDIMVGITDDVGAILASCFFLWSSIRLIKRGFSIGRLGPWLVALALCYLTKNTAWYALVLAPLILLLSFLRGRLLWLPWAVTLLMILGGALVMFEGGGAASWYQDRTQVPPFRLESANAPLGSHIFQLDYSGGRRPLQTGQFISQSNISTLRGKTATLGAWVWADSRVSVHLPIIRFITDQGSTIAASRPAVWLQRKPYYFRTVITVPANAAYAILIPPYVLPNSGGIKLYFDGIVLTDGAYPAGVPQFRSPAGSEGTWNGHPFQNVIENGSAEQAALRVRPSIDQAASRWLSNIGTLSAISSLTADWQGIGWYYGMVFQTLFRTFWTSVAADKFNLPGNVNTDILLGLTGAGIVGTARLLWRKRKALRWDLVYILLAAGILVWGITAVRGVPSILAPSRTIPWSRYAFPAIFPTALVICAGWAEWLRLIGMKYRLSRKALYMVPIGMMGLLSLYVLFNVEKYFHHSLAAREPLFWLFGILLVAFVLLWKRSQLVASFKQV